MPESRAIAKLSRTALLGLVLLILAACGGKDALNSNLEANRLQNTPSPSLDQVLDEIQSSSPPAPVDPVVWADLTQELARVITANGTSRLCSAPPKGEVNQVTDLELVDDGSGGYLLSWTYVNIGDYDLNGEVYVSDLTPIGQHFKAKSSDPDWSTASVADGDRNGEVNVSDVTPIGQNFRARVSGYAIYGATSPTGPFTNIGTVLFSEGQKVTSSAGGHIRFNLPLEDESLTEFSVEPYDATIPPPPPGAEDWTMYGHDIRHTGRSVYSGPRTNAIKWTSTSGSRMTSSLVLDPQGNLYYRNEHGRLVCLDESGTQQWDVEVGPLGYAGSTPAIGQDGTIYIGGGTELVAVDPAGSIRWTFDTGADIYDGSPLLADSGEIYQCSAAGTFKISAGGNQLWFAPEIGGKNSSPALALDGDVIVPGGGKITALDPDTGSVNWDYQFANGGSQYSCAVGTDGTVYCGATTGILVAVAPGGTELWHHWIYSENYGGIRARPSLGLNGLVYVGAWDHNFYALDAADGSIAWIYHSNSVITDGAAIDAEGTVYFGNLVGELTALTPAGELIWQHNPGGTIASEPVVGADGTLYIGASTFDVIAYQDTPGSFTVGEITGPAELPEDIEAAYTIPASGASEISYEWSFDGEINGTFTAVHERTTTFEPSNVSADKTGLLRVEVGAAGQPSQTREIEVTVLDTDFQKGRGDWWMLGADVGHRYYVQHAAPHTPTMQWEWERIDQGLSQNLVEGFDGTLYACTGMQGALVALDIDKGVPKWMLSLGGPSYTTPAQSSAGNVLVGCNDGYFYAVHPVSGEVIWRFRTEGQISHSPLVGSDDRIYFFSDDEKLYCLGPNGNEIWSYDFDWKYGSSPVMGPDNVLYIVVQHALYAFDAYHGSVLWTYSDVGEETGYSLWSDPHMGPNGNIYVLANEQGSYTRNRILAIDMGTEDIERVFELEQEQTEILFLALDFDTNLYYGASDGMIYAVTADDAPLWSYQLPDAPIGAPVVDSQEIVYIGCADDNVYALNNNSVPLWTYTAWDPTVKCLGMDGTLYIEDATGNIEALANP